MNGLYLGSDVQKDLRRQGIKVLSCALTDDVRAQIYRHRRPVTAVFRHGVERVRNSHDTGAEWDIPGSGMRPEGRW